MDPAKQKLLIEYLISSPDTFAVCQSILKPSYFDPEFRPAVKFIQKYFEEYSSTPTPEQLKAESRQVFEKRVIEPDKIRYCTTEVETFCKRKAMENAVIESAKLLNAGDYGGIEQQIKDAILVSLHKDLGTQYFNDPMARLNNMLQDDPTETTGWKTVDELLHGGITRGELVLFSANSGGGKSITLANLGMNFAKRGRNVLYVSLELSEKIICQRFDTMLTGYNRKTWKGHVSEIATRVETLGKTAGHLDIVQMASGTTTSDLRAYLKEYYLFNRFMPDLLIIDYIDNMAPNEHISADNVWGRDKSCSEQLRQLGVDFQMFIATASQLNREAVKATHHDHSHIAGGISKINVSDVYISIKMTEAMKVKGEMLFSFQKTRNSDGVGKNRMMKWDGRHLLISDLADPEQDLVKNMVKKEKPGIGETPTKDGFMELFEDNK